jgi:hypothetical protein
MNWRFNQKKEERKLYRSWNHAYSTKSDPEILKLEDQAHQTRVKLHELRERGKRSRLHRLQDLDALEMRRVTLAEILKRMKNELKAKDVHSYGDVLAEVFGQRKIYAHRAIGLESLLCQMMHQMLAKQHQLKIIKESGKTIQQFYKQQKIRNQDEFHSYDALAVQLEAARLSLLAMYDDIFAQQHRVLAMLKDLKPEGTTANYTIPTLENKATKPTLFVSTKHQVSVEDLASPESLVSSADHDHDDYQSAMDILEEASLSSGRKTSPRVKVPPQRAFLHEEKIETKPVPPLTTKDPKDKSARQRRREIEHLLQARVLGNAAAPRNSSAIAAPLEEEPDAKTHRQRMRELEAVRKKLKTREFEGDEEANVGKEDDDILRPRGARSPRKGSPRKVPPSKVSPRKVSPHKVDEGKSKPQLSTSDSTTNTNDNKEPPRPAGDDEVKPLENRSPNSVSESINEKEVENICNFAEKRTIQAANY